MIIDRILDRKDNEELDGFDSYNAHDFYFDVLAYGKIGDDITYCMDTGDETDVRLALCRYILRNGYNPDLCTYVHSKKWLVNAN